MSMKLCTQIRFILRNICVDFRNIELGNRRIGGNWKSKFGNIVALRSFWTRSESHRGYFVIVHLFLHYTRMVLLVSRHWYIDEKGAIIDDEYGFGE